MRSSTHRAASVAILGLLIAASLTGCAEPPPPPSFPQAEEPPPPPPPPVPEPAPAPAAADPAPDRIVELKVFFELNSHRINPKTFPVLQSLAEALGDRQLAGYHFEINGYTDISGRFGYNVALSKLRAEAVVDFLIAHGVSRDSITAQGFGPIDPLIPSNPRSPANRRVVIISTK